MKTTLTILILLTVFSLNAFAQDVPSIVLRGHTNAVHSVAFSPDGSLLASGSDDDTIRLWNAETGTHLRTLEGHSDPVRSVVFSPDGNLLASAGWNDTIHLWDPETGTHLRTLSGHTGSVRSVVFSPDGQTLASWSSDDTIRLWDVETGTHLRTLSGHADSVDSVVFRPDGSLLASGSDDDTIRLWNTETGAHLRTLSGHTWDVNSVVFSPDGSLLASGSWEDIRLWDVETGIHLRTLEGHTGGFSVVFSPDGSLLASGGVDNTIRLWNAETGAHLRTLGGHTGDVNNVVFSPDGQTLASWVASWDSDYTIRLWDVETGIHLRTLEGHTQDVYSTSFSPDGQTLASGSWEDIRLWDLSTVVNTYTTVNISPSSVESPAVGEQFTINVDIVGGQDIRGYLITIAYDSRKLQYVSHTHDDYLPGNVFEGPTINSPGQKWTIEDVNGDGVVDIGDLIWVNQGLTRIWNTPARVSFNVTSPGGAGNGDGTLVTITFEVVARKTSTFIVSGFLSNSDGEKLPFIVKYGKVLESSWDVNGDGVVNVLDLSFVAARFGQNDQTEADVNGDGVVNIQDLIVVASEIEAVAAAPSAYPQVSTLLTAKNVQQWLRQAQQLNLTDATSQRGILFLEQLLAALTPKETSLLPNYPNPFNPETWIPYQLAAPTDVTLRIYAVDGTIVRTLKLGHQPVGIYQNKSRAAYWDGKNALGEPVASGVYFYTLTAGDFTATRKMLIRK